MNSPVITEIVPDLVAKGDWEKLDEWFYRPNSVARNDILYEMLKILLKKHP